MRIKSSIGKNVAAAMNDCRKVIVKETINLLKQIGAEPGQDVKLGKMLILMHQQPDGMTETVLCDRVAYSKSCDGSEYISTCFTDAFKFCRVSYSQTTAGLALQDLQIIFEEVKRVVRKH